MRLQLQIGSRACVMDMEPGEQDGQFRGILDGQAIEIDAVLVEPEVVSLLMRSGPLAGRSFRCVFSRDRSSDGEGQSRQVVLAGKAFGYDIIDPRALNVRKRRADGDGGPLLLKASMAGRVARLLVEVGSDVEAQVGVIVIEAMKMQNELRAARAGRVTEIRVQPGEMVSAGQVLAVIE